MVMPAATRHLALAVVGVRSSAVTHKIALHLDRFVAFIREGYGHDRISTCLRRDVLAWQKALVADGLAPATVNNHLASLSAFTTWVAVRPPTVFPVGDPAKGVRELGLPPLEPRALTPAQLRSLKNLCARLEQVAADLPMVLVFSTPGMPRGRGRIERFFQTVNQL